jgi:hypothetical protein
MATAPVVTLKADPPSHWVLRFDQCTPIGHLYFAPFRGITHGEGCMKGGPTDWHNDVEQALAFHTQHDAELMCRWLASRWQSVGSLPPLEAVEVKVT